MMVQGFSGMDFQTNRHKYKKDALDLAYGVKVDRGRLETLEGNERINATSLGAAIMGGYDYRPKGADGGTIKVLSDGTIYEGTPPVVTPNPSFDLVYSNPTMNIIGYYPSYALFSIFTPLVCEYDGDVYLSTIDATSYVSTIAKSTDSCRTFSADTTDTQYYMHGKMIEYNGELILLGSGNFADASYNRGYRKKTSSAGAWSAWVADKPSFPIGTRQEIMDAIVFDSKLWIAYLYRPTSGTAYRSLSLGYTTDLDSFTTASTGINLTSIFVNPFEGTVRPTDGRFFTLNGSLYFGTAQATSQAVTYIFKWNGSSWDSITSVPKESYRYRSGTPIGQSFYAFEPSFGDYVVYNNTGDIHIFSVASDVFTDVTSTFTLSFVTTDSTNYLCYMDVYDTGSITYNGTTFSTVDLNDGLDTSATIYQQLVVNGKTYFVCVTGSGPYGLNIYEGNLF